MDLAAVRYIRLHIFSSKFIKKFLQNNSVKSCSHRFFLSFPVFSVLHETVLICSLISSLSSNACSSFSFKLSPLLCVGQLVGRAVGKDPVNSLSVEGFVQKTLVTSPEVAHLSLLLFNDTVHYL